MIEKRNKEIKATYDLITGYKNSKTNEWLALSEFIDNSISRYLKDSKDTKGLEINIKVDFSDEKNMWMSIKDNAGGMNPDTLLDSMQPSNSVGKKDTDINQYGVGMKLGIFFFGEDGIIYSKEKNKPEYVVDFSTSNKPLEQTVFLDCVESNENILDEPGTYILIKKVYKNRNFLTKKGLYDKIQNAFGWRYKNYITEGLKISVHTKSSNDFDGYETVDIKEISLQPMIGKSILNKNKDQREREWNIQKEILEEFLKSSSSSQFRKDAIKKFLDNKEMYFSKIIEVNNKPAELKFGIMSDISNMKKYCGITSYHRRRAINHGPNEISSCIVLDDPIYGVGTETRFRWMFGEIDLTGIEVPDVNKSDFNWSSDGKREIINEFYKCYKELEPIINFLVEVTQLKTVKESNKDQLEKTKISISNMKLNGCHQDVELTENNELKINTNYTDSNTIQNGKSVNFKNTTFYIKEDSTLDINTFADWKMNPDNRIVRLTVNPNHVVWKPFFTDTNDKAKMFMYKIIFLIVLSDDINKQKKYFNNQNDDNDIFKTLIDLLKGN